MEEVMKKILIIEDEEELAEGLKDNLEFEGFECVISNNGREGEWKVRTENPDCVILDIMLPEKSGFEVCKSLRNSKITTPIIMLTAKGEEIDKILGLELGADDYITKPFSLRELLARIKAVLRRKDEFSSSNNEKIKIGKIELIFDKYLAWENNQEIQMTTKEFELIKYLYENQGETISKEELMEKVWGYSSLTQSRTVDNYIAKVRKKIEEDPSKPRHLFTLYGNGYRLNL